MSLEGANLFNLRPFLEGWDGFNEPLVTSVGEVRDFAGRPPQHGIAGTLKKVLKSDIRVVNTGVTKPGASKVVQRPQAAR